MIDVKETKTKDPDTYKIIGVQPMIGNLGAEISNVRLDDLNEETFAEVKRAFLEYQIIVFRDQDITYESHVEFARRFGELFVHPFIPPMKDYPEMIRLLKEPTDEVNNGGAWHYDLTFMHRPPLGSILRLIDVPNTGGDTMFSNMYSAYNALSNPMKKYLEGLKAVHTSNQLFGPAGFYTHFKDKTSMGQFDDVEDFVTLHPLVRTHPQTGKKGIFVSPGYVERIMGIPEREGADILEFLYNHCARGEFTTRLKWQKHTFAMWDNRCAMHYAINDYPGQRREGVRVSIAGGRPS